MNKIILGLSMLAMMLMSNSAYAIQLALDNFNAHYGLKVTSCSLCHTSPPALNNFGVNFKSSGGGKPSYSPNFTTLDSLDADANNIPNGQQIANGKSPADNNITLASLSTGPGATPLGTASVTGCISSGVSAFALIALSMLGLGFLLRRQG